jgi:hypothetical protein
MNPATKNAIDALNGSPIGRGGGTLDICEYSFVQSMSDARRLAESREWERTFTNIYSGIFIRALQPTLRELGRSMADTKEQIHAALAPAIKAVRLAGWSEIPRFPFEGLLTQCCAELEFSDILQPVFFYPRLFPVLCAGHFPCGWEGDPIPASWTPRCPEDLPKGKLMVHLVNTSTGQLAARS